MGRCAREGIGRVLFFPGGIYICARAAIKEGAVARRAASAIPPPDERRRGGLPRSYFGFYDWVFCCLIENPATQNPATHASGGLRGGGGSGESGGHVSVCVIVRFLEVFVQGLWGYAPFLIQNPKKRTGGFLMGRFLNARN